MQGIELRSDIPVKESETMLKFLLHRKRAVGDFGISKWDIHFAFAWYRIQNYWFNKGL